MVIPWVGFPLKRLLDKVEPLGTAKYVAFETYYSKKQMPYASYAGIDFPYVEGLRLDEAQHNLTILATGLYGKQMPNQNGAPVRLTVPPTAPPTAVIASAGPSTSVSLATSVAAASSAQRCSTGASEKS